MTFSLNKKNKKNINDEDYIKSLLDNTSTTPFNSNLNLDDEVNKILKESEDIYGGAPLNVV